MKAIQVHSEEEFERLLDRVSNDAYRAADYWRLLQGLDACVEEYGREFTQNATFWGFALNAMHEAVLSYLGRLYDKSGTAVSIQRLLLTAKSCPNYFSEQAFRNRLRDSPYVDSLAEKARTLNLPELDDEIRSVSTSDALVKRLQDIRDKFVAHRDANMVRLAALSLLAGLSAEDMETLLKRATNITFKYSSLYRASSLSSNVSGDDDYKDLLRLVKRSLDSIAATHEEEYRLAREQSQGTPRITLQRHWQHLAKYIKQRFWISNARLRAKEF
jgi:hypothetical protein